jgi:cytochrome c553
MAALRRVCASIGAALSLCLAGAGLAATPADPPPDWAFPVNPPSRTSSAPALNRIEHVAGSKLTFTDRQVNDEFFVADWFPGEHGPMPAAVNIGRKPAVMPCAVCHLPTGNGGPAEAALPGLSARYMLEQIDEFRAGRREVAQPKMQSAREMEKLAKAVTDADLAAAARYFSQLKFTSHFHVVETDTAPRTRIGLVSLHVKLPGSEPLGQRIIEMPDDARQWELGNPHTEFTAYVPKGSIARGAALVSSGDGAAPCRSCHGADLKGTGDVPPLAGRSPSYLARQLYDIQHGTRQGPAVALMRPEVAHMTPEDRIAIVAYLGSLGS